MCVLVLELFLLKKEQSLESVCVFFVCKLPLLVLNPKNACFKHLIGALFTVFFYYF